MMKKLSCINISSKNPKRLAKSYKTIGIPVYVKKVTMKSRGL